MKPVERLSSAYTSYQQHQEEKKAEAKRIESDTADWNAICTRDNIRYQAHITDYQRDTKGIQTLYSGHIPLPSYVKDVKTCRAWTGTLEEWLADRPTISPSFGADPRRPWQLR